MSDSGITFRTALAFWWKLGWISFGGPAGQIAIMHRELVERRRWISEHRFLHALNYCMVLPGPEAQQLATYLGWLMHRTWGGIVAGALFVLPSYAVLGVLSWIYLAFGKTLLVSGFVYGVKPAVTAIVVHAAWRIGGKTLRHPVWWIVAVLALLAMIGGLPFPAILGIAAVVGLAVGHWRPAWLAKPGGGNGHGAKAEAAAEPGTRPLIDDDTPPPAHARVRPVKQVLTALLGVGLGVGVYAAVRAFDGSGLLATAATFFTKAALLTFGGAYAVLPYVAQAAVEQFHWLTPAQMIDGLALGESTPGPLIMIVAYVGFVAGWSQGIFGADSLAAAGWAGAAVATFFTFLPSFLFILVGAPLVEATRGNLRLAAPLTAISAAVVGVIVHLAGYFALHVFWPQGFGTMLDFWALPIAVLAALALFRLQWGVVRVILLAGAIGVLLALIR